MEGFSFVESHMKTLFAVERLVSEMIGIGVAKS